MLGMVVQLAGALEAQLVVCLVGTESAAASGWRRAGRPPAPRFDKLTAP